MNGFRYCLDPGAEVFDRRCPRSTNVARDRGNRQCSFPSTCLTAGLLSGSSILQLCFAIDFTHTSGSLSVAKLGIPRLQVFDGRSHLSLIPLLLSQQLALIEACLLSRKCLEGRPVIHHSLSSLNHGLYVALGERAKSISANAQRVLATLQRTSVKDCCVNLRMACCFLSRSFFLGSLICLILRCRQRLPNSSWST
jgi:hypothetical protein